MAEITASLVKELRDKTDAPMMECKKALAEAGGDLAKAEEILRVKLGNKASKAASRVTAEGIVAVHVSADGRLGAMVELNCETDFVARTDDFKSLAYDISMQVAAMSPRYVSVEEIAEEDYAELEREFGDRESAIKAVVLNEQAFIKDPKMNTGDLVKEAISKLGENIVVRRIVRFELGETADATAEA